MNTAFFTALGAQANVYAVAGDPLSKKTILRGVQDS